MCSTSLYVSAQGDGSNCMELVKTTYKKLNERSTLSLNVFYMDYSMSMNVDPNLTERDRSAYSTRVKLYANSEKSYLISESIEVYQDQHHTLSILKEEKLIYVSEFIGLEAKRSKVSHLGFLQDTLFDLSKVVSCEEVGSEWLAQSSDLVKRYKKIRMELNSSGKNLFNTDALTFYIDSENKTIKRVIIEYAESHNMKNLIVTFNEIKYDYSTDKLDAEAISIALSSDNKLRLKYKDYTLVDTRSHNAGN